MPGKFYLYYAFFTLYWCLIIIIIFCELSTNNLMYIFIALHWFTSKLLQANLNRCKQERIKIFMKTKSAELQFWEQLEGLSYLDDTKGFKFLEYEN